MAEPHTGESGSAAAADRQQTTEFHVAGGHGQEGSPEGRERAVLPALAGDLRDQLPGLEPERQVTDWGRSERLEGLVDRLLLDFLYHYWFRVEVDGVENLPADGGALLLANHSGALPADAVMIAKAIREHLPGRRSVHMVTEGSLTGVPAVGMMVSKLGGVAGHPANLHRLLYDEQQLVLAFPEGRGGARKAVGRRYLLRRFAPELVQAAGRAQSTIIPVALLGAEEAAPVVTRLGAIGAMRRRLPRLPLTAPLPLPAKFRIRFLEPVECGSLAGDRAAEATLAQDIRGLIQENLLEMVGARRSVWLG